MSYGEDYATALAISRKYLIARIYDPLYLCRRWEENSDHDLDIQQLNNYNFYKDKIRTLGNPGPNFREITGINF